MLKIQWIFIALGLIISNINLQIWEETWMFSSYRLAFRIFLSILSSAPFEKQVSKSPVNSALSGAGAECYTDYIQHFLWGKWRRLLSLLYNLTIRVLPLTLSFILPFSRAGCWTVSGDGPAVGVSGQASFAAHRCCKHTASLASCPWSKS